jgi:hypothetical protein
LMWSLLHHIFLCKIKLNVMFCKCKNNVWLTLHAGWWLV